jgi:hypothetical protein
MDWRPGETLAEAKARLRANLDHGMRCPLCNQFAKKYRRKLNSGMARALINIYKRGGRSDLDWVYIPNLSAKSREEGKIAYWKLLKEADEVRPDGGRAGWWRVTPLGEHFILHGMRIPKIAFVYDAVCLGFDRTEMVSIQDCLGDRFDLGELMGR